MNNEGENIHFDKINSLVKISLLMLFITQSHIALVKVYEKLVQLPTRAVEEAGMMPDWRRYRYPYTMFDMLTNENCNGTLSAR